MLHLALIHIDLASIVGVIHHLIEIAGSVLGPSSSG
jgi:hypothetical protein